jgi:hypothetical protein
LPNITCHSFSVVNPRPGRPSVPAMRCCTWSRPSLVRNVRGVPSSPMIRENPVSGCSGLASQ